MAFEKRLQASKKRFIQGIGAAEVEQEPMADQWPSAGYLGKGLAQTATDVEPVFRCSFQKFDAGGNIT